MKNNLIAAPGNYDFDAKPKASLPVYHSYNIDNHIS